MAQGYTNSIYPEDSGSPLVANAANNFTIAGGVNYINTEVENILKGNSSPQTKSTTKISDNIVAMDIAQSHHFTVQLEDMEGMSNFRTPQGTFSEFLPVKTMSLKYTSYENMSIPVAIFGDFPLLNKKRVSTIDLSCYDLDNNKIEYELRRWESQCFPQGKFVAYMDDIARRFTYRGYSVEGRQTLIYEVYVIPAGNVTVSRDYSANEAKMVNFSLVVVGDGRTCASGIGKLPGEIPIQDNGGGAGVAGAFATVYATNWGNYNEKLQGFTL